MSCVACRELVGRFCYVFINTYNNIEFIISLVRRTGLESTLKSLLFFNLKYLKSLYKTSSILMRDALVNLSRYSQYTHSSAKPTRRISCREKINIFENFGGSHGEKVYRHGLR